jgi:hypothetical protein
MPNGTVQDMAAVASLTADYMNRCGWSKDAVRSCSFEMDEKPAGPHCLGRAANLAADRLGIPFGPVHEMIAREIRDRYPDFALAGSEVDVIAEWNNHPAVTRADVDAILAGVAQ